MIISLIFGLTRYCDRYNESFNVDDRHPLVRTLSIPSPLLDNHKLEILVHTTSSTSGPTNTGAARFLVPGLETANSASGRLSMITYPVHKSLIYEQGLNFLGTFATIERNAEDYSEGQMLRGVVDWSWSSLQYQNRIEQHLLPINLALAEAAIERFRSSLDKSMEYEHLWFDAGMPALSAWLLGGTETQSASMKPATGNLIRSIYHVAYQEIANQEAASTEKELAARVPDTTKNVINQGISFWAENSHKELRDRLDSAFYSKSWRKTKWWKLLWRVDDVSYIASDILQRAWLVQAEKEMIWITGRIHQSGLLGPPKLRPIQPVDPEDEEQKLGGKPPAPTAADLVPRSSTFSDPSPAQQPWPQDISRARSTLSSLTIPPLQALSQALLIQTLSTNILTSSLSVLLYISISTTSIYESGAIAAVGLVYSLRRLQKRWETARNEWEVQLREEGRRVLRRTEDLAREAVKGVEPQVDEIGKRERDDARQTLNRVREAMESLKG